MNSKSFNSLPMEMDPKEALLMLKFMSPKSTNEEASTI